MTRLKSFLCLSALLAAAPAAELPPGFAETRIATGLNPVTMTFAPDGRLFLCEKQGLLRVVAGDKLLEKPALDLTAIVDSWNERGMLGVCFDPDFQKNGWIYIYHTHNRDRGDKSHRSSNNRVSRFTMKGDSADPASEKIILEIDNLSKTGWHNGGGLAFGKDGKLYISTGENANGANAQDDGNLLGKVLRLEKDGSIPRDNPYDGKFGGKNRAIVALGLRNPFSLAVRNDGLMYINMVGANFEQIERYDTAARPEPVNYGWPDLDGPPKKNAKLPPDYRAPEYAYDHGAGRGVALCSGDFYQPASPGADAFPAEFAGRYFFGDYAGWIKCIDPAKPSERMDFASGIDRALDVKIAPDGALWYIERGGKPGGSDDANSESKNGTLWRVRWTGEGRSDKPSAEKSAPVLIGLKFPATAEGDLPATLSATGIFTDRKLTPRAGVVPYFLNGTVWADGAEIRRWVALPDGGKAGFAPTGGYTWPGGTVFVQQFELPAGRRLETRVLVLDATGAFGYGLSYRWRTDGSDADLVPAEGRDEPVEIAGRSQTWTHPSRGLCYMCHTPGGGFVIGAKTSQLNGSYEFVKAKPENQLLVWDRLGMFDPRPDAKSISGYAKLSAISDTAAPLETRVHSYLDANCAHCHRPGGTGAGWDARFETPLAGQGIVGGEVRNNFGIAGAQIVVPGNLEKSILYHRMSAANPAERMPPVTSNAPDTVSLEFIKSWIEGLRPGPRGDR